MRVSDYTINRLRVLKAILASGPVARTELPALTGLSGATITQFTTDLLDRGLIAEHKDRTRTPGRPRTYLEIDAGRGIVIGASMSGRGTLELGFVDLAGKLCWSHEVALPRPATLADMAGGIAERLAEVIAASPFPPGAIIRVGLALPALVDSMTGCVHAMSTFAAGDPVPFAAIIAARIGLPVTIENDVTCMARAEHWFGHARGLDTFTLIQVGFAIGSAGYAEGLPRSHGGGLNVEIGHTKAEAGALARPCYCGLRGCFSAYASMYGLLEHAGALRSLAFPPVRSLAQLFDELMDRATAGEPEAAAAIADAAGHLGVMLANLVMTTGPGTVLIAFDNERYKDMAAAPLLAAIEANVMPGYLRFTPIRMIPSRTDWRWSGTAALALEQAYLAAA